MNDNTIYDIFVDNEYLNDIETINDYLINENSVFTEEYLNLLKYTENDIIRSLHLLYRYINDNFMYCSNCGALKHIEDTYYMEGSEDGYYSFIFDYDIEYTCEVDLTESLASYVFENIPSYFDNNYFCDDCIQDLEEEVIQLVEEYKDNNTCYIKNYHSSTFKNKAKSILTLGFEIEHEFISYPKYEDIKKFLSEHNPIGFLHAEYDGSLNNGIEWITDILDFQFLFDNKEFIEEFYNTIEELLDCSSNCGGHLHTNINFCGDTQEEINNTIINLIEFINQNDLLIKDISGRKNNAFDYCELPQDYNIYDKISTNKYSAINIKEDTVEFRFWYTYKSFSTMLKRAVISYYMVYLAKNDMLTVKNLYFNLNMYNLTSETNFKWYLNKIKNHL